MLKYCHSRPLPIIGFLCSYCGSYAVPNLLEKFLKFTRYVSSTLVTASPASLSICLNTGTIISRLERVNIVITAIFIFRFGDYQLFLCLTRLSKGFAYMYWNSVLEQCSRTLFQNVVLIHNAVTGHCSKTHRCS